jgi:hypothetical protein
MTLLMRDSIDPFAIPLTNLAAVAGYADGSFVWSSAGWALFPPPIVSLSIVVDAANQGDILDVERFDAVPGDCPGWADRFNRPGRRRPTIYCNRDTIGAVRQAMGTRPFDWWCATLDGTQNVAGAVAVQYAGSAQTGANYDESIIWDASWIGQQLPGGDMAAAVRPDGSAIDYFVVKADTSLDHYVWTFAGGMQFNNNLAGGLVPNSVSATWVGTELVVFAQSPDGTIWAIVFDGNAWSNWASQGIKGALPSGGAVMPHTHPFSGTTGNPA